MAHPGHDDDDDAPAADFVYDHPDHMIQPQVLENTLQYDADLTLVGGQVWAAWLEFLPDQGDVIWVGRREKNRWALQTKLSLAAGAYARPTLTADASGALWLSYEAETNDQWDVFALPLNQQGKPSGKPQRISQNAVGADIRHRTVATPQGGLWCFWQTDQRGQFDIVARQFGGGKMQSIQRISDNDHSDWNVAAQSDSQGNLHVAWDGYDGESHNVYYRSAQSAKQGFAWRQATTIAASANFEGRPDLAIDHTDRVWIAWEQGGGNWGRPYRGILTPTIGDQLGPLHRYRRLHVAVVDEQGAAQPLTHPLPTPQWEAAENRADGKVIKHTGVFYERPKLSVDGVGRIWVAYRHFYAPWLGYEHRSHIEQGWGLYARCYGEEGWSALQQFAIGQGDGMQRLELASPRTAGELNSTVAGLHAIWTTGRTDRRDNERPRGLVLGVIRLPGQAAKSIGLTPTKAVAANFPAANVRRRPTAEVDEKQYSLFYGDLHRHTDLSLCRVPIDGTTDDAYRYASDVAQLDFLGITDHTRDIAKGDALSQLWWRCRKEVYRNQLGDRFLPFYAYERSHGNTADHNVISLRPDMLRPYTYPVPKFWEELGPDTITIPHQPIRRDTWKYQNNELRPLMEIFQGCRDQSIETHAHVGLGKGYLLGFIASSDHMSTSASYACVWAEEATRESIFAAFKARRTFGANANIQLKATAGTHWMGEEIHVAALPPLQLSVIGTAPIRLIELLVDGHVVKTYSPNKKHVELEENLELSGAHYIYFRVTQVDGNKAWSSPFFLKPPK